MKQTTVTQDPLSWVQQNRARRTCMNHAGLLVARVAEQLQQGSSPAGAELAAVLAGVVDEDFKAHCRVGGVRGGKLVVTVDHPGRVAPMRLRWLSRLQEIGSRNGRGRQVGSSRRAWRGRLRKRGGQRRSAYHVTERSRLGRHKGRAAPAHWVRAAVRLLAYGGAWSTGRPWWFWRGPRCSRW